MPPVTPEEHVRAKLRSQRMYETDLVSDLATEEDRGEKKRALAISEELVVNRASASSGYPCNRFAL